MNNKDELVSVVGYSPKNEMSALCDRIEEDEITLKQYGIDRIVEHYKHLDLVINDLGYLDLSDKTLILEVKIGSLYRTIYYCFENDTFMLSDNVQGGIMMRFREKIRMALLRAYRNKEGISTTKTDSGRAVWVSLVCFYEDSTKYEVYIPGITDYFMCYGILKNSEVIKDRVDSKVLDHIMLSLRGTGL